jgi:hypothetical protein
MIILVVKKDRIYTAEVKPSSVFFDNAQHIVDRCCATWYQWEPRLWHGTFLLFENFLWKVPFSVSGAFRQLG